MAKAASAGAGGFGGFSKDLIPFLKSLDANNEKAWFDAHRAEYDALFLEPAKAFVSAIGAKLPKVVPGARAEARVNGSIMRINRDVRFSKDKRPYRPAMMFRFAIGEGPIKESPAMMVRIAKDELGFAAGAFGFLPAQLERYREAVLDPKRARALNQAVEKVRKAGPWELGEPALKRVPRGFPADHASAELLRHKGCYVHGALALPKELFTAKAVPFVLDRFKELRPVLAWLDANLSP